MSISSLKVVTIVGTRPEIIRLSRTMDRLDECCTQVVVHTGQNYDYELNEIFYNELNIRKPDHYLGVDTASLGKTVGEILSKTEEVLVKEKPDAVLILGDTNSAIAAYIARRMKIPVYHMEAGNRCFDRNVPEETNRKLVDHLSDFNLTYTEHARRNLLAEGLPSRRIVVTGSPMREVLEHYRSNIESSTVLEQLGLEKGKYYLASIHREENVDNPDHLRSMIKAMEMLAVRDQVKFIISTHPRTKKQLEAIGDKIDPLLTWAKPFGFFDYNSLQCNAACVISDSGTIAEESSILGFRAVTPRLSIERPEAIDTGAIMACGVASQDIVRCVDRMMSDNLTPEGESNSFIPADYQITNTSQRVCNLIMSTAKLSNSWDGIR